MSKRRMKTINVPDMKLSFIQDYAEEAINQYADISILDGVPIKRLAFTSGVDLVIKHGLGRQWIGWIVSRKSNAADIFESSATNFAPKNTIILQANANVTLDLWVF